MSDVKQLVHTLFESRNIIVPSKQSVIFEKFVHDPENVKTIGVIIEKLDLLMENWKLENRIADIIQQPVRILNATVGKPYETKMDFDVYNWTDIESFEFEGLDAVGLHYDSTVKQIIGVPTQSGDTAVIFKFKISGQSNDSAFNEKKIPLTVNPDPKSLWKNLESNKDDPYWKPDDVTVFEPLGDRFILVSCKRGRAHANIGSFREDDFAFKHLETSKWSIIVAADGAGSAKFSRKGSAIACQSVIDYFSEHLKGDLLSEFDTLLQQHKTNTGEDTQKKLNNFVYNNLGKAALYVHKKLEEFAAHATISLKDLNTTLIFTLLKKFDTGYALLSFGVGDCPIGLLDKDEKAITMMNWIDVGEFGGGTRFITMPEIFQSDKFATRFGFKLIEDFSYLMLMTDGIYDPKFVVESNLEDIKKWQEFLLDLNGKNEDGAKVDLDPDNPEITSQFSTWMDFWSPGNHDDRTLAIVF